MSMFEQFFSAVQSKTSAVVAATAAGVGAAVGGVGGPVGAQFTIGDRRVEVVKQIAEGGFAFVYLVREVGSEQLFAVKRLLVNDDEDFAKVKEEIEFMKKMPPHKNIVEFRGASVGSSRSRGAREVYIMMEFCQGPSLYSILDERFGNHLPEAEILSIFSDVCEGVAHMHSMNPPIAHRDIKVENVLKHKGRYKLCDFGSATTKPIKAESVREINAADDLIQRHTTMMYRSPEMVDLYQRKLINEKVDIWALGCLLYRLCFFRHPFEEGSGLQILNVRYSIPETSPYSDNIHSLIKYMIEPDPDVRPDIFQVLERVSQLRSVPCAVTRPLKSSSTSASAVSSNGSQVEAVGNSPAPPSTADDSDSAPPPITQQSNSFIFALLDGGSASASQVATPSSPSRVAAKATAPSTPPSTPARVSATSLNTPPAASARVGLTENLTESIDSVLFGSDSDDTRLQKAAAAPAAKAAPASSATAHSELTSTSFFAQAPANFPTAPVAPSVSAAASTGVSAASSATASPRSRLIRAQSEITPSSIVDLGAFTQLSSSQKSNSPQTPPAVTAVAASAASSHRRSPSLSVVDSSWFAAPTDIQPQPPPYQPASPESQAAPRTAATPLQPVSAVHHHQPLVAGMHSSPRGHQRAVSTGDWFGTHGAAHHHQPQQASAVLQPSASGAGRSVSAARTYDELRSSLNDLSLSSGGSSGSSPVMPLSSSAGAPFTGFQSAPQAQGIATPFHQQQQQHFHSHHLQQQQQQQYQAASAPSLFNMFATAASTRTGAPGSPAAGRGSPSTGDGAPSKPDPFSNLIKW